MSKNVKIVMTGGGSYNWIPHIMCDMMRAPELKGSEVFLLDSNVQAANEVKVAVETMSKTLGSGFKFTAGSSEEKAFAGADFVVITISTGDLEMMRHDLKIPEKYGIFHTVGDSVGPGGWSRTLRNVPVFVKMAQKIEKLSPKAIILNYTNPMAALTGAIYASTSLRAVGLCHGVFGAYNLLEKIFGVEEKDLCLKYGGVNHFFWVTDFTVKGKPGYPLLAKKLAGRSVDEYFAEVHKDEAGMAHHKHKLLDELYRQYNYLTYPGDRHTCEFLPGYINNGKAPIKRFGLVRTSIEDRYDTRKNARERAAKMASGEMSPFPRTRETAVDIMTAFITNKPFIDVVNMPNIGQIDNLPRGAVVETMGIVDARGFTPVSVGGMPREIQPVLEAHCKVQKMTLEAAMKGDLELALHSLMLDPLCANLPPSDVRNMGLELIKATKSWLPQF
jgi:alpha-galactosidase